MQKLPSGQYKHTHQIIFISEHQEIYWWIAARAYLCAALLRTREADVAGDEDRAAAVDELDESDEDDAEDDTDSCTVFNMDARPASGSIRSTLGLSQPPPIW